MRKVDVKIKNQPKKDRAISAMAIPGSAICKTTSGMGRHCQNNKINARLANRT